jgi:hypothetical protein
MRDKGSTGSEAERFEAQSVERETLRRQRSAVARKPRNRRSRRHKGHLSCSQMYGAAVDSKIFAVRIRVEGSAGSEAESVEMKYIQAESIEARNIAAEMVKMRTIEAATIEAENLEAEKIEMKCIQAENIGA